MTGESNCFYSCGFVHGFDHFVMCSLRVKALRQRSWGPLPPSLLFGVAERKISKGVKAKLTSQTTPASMVWYVLHTCGRAEAVTCAVSGARAIARTNAQSRWRESKERKIPAPAPSRHAPRKRGAWRVLLLGLDLWYPVRSSPLCRAIAVAPCIGAVRDGRASVGPFTWKGAQSHFVIFYGS